MKGILFKPWKIKFIAGSDRELQTRRLGGLKEINQEPDKWILVRRDQMIGIPADTFIFHNKVDREADGERIAKFIKPRYQVGEVGYIKEAYKVIGTSTLRQGDKAVKEAGIDYKDGTRIDRPCPLSILADQQWHSPMMMPAWAARYFIKITDIRAERLQEITEADAGLEGFMVSPGITSGGSIGLMSAVACFKETWNSINAKWKRVYNKRLKIYEYWQFPWAEEDAVPIPKNTQHPERYHCIPNPWDFVYSFKRVEAEK